MKSISLYLIFFALLILQMGCASLSGLQTGKTLEENTGELAFSLNLNQSPDFDSDSTEILFLPNLEFGGRYGVAEHLDIGVRANTNLNLLIDGKYQFVGDQDSEFALATGVGFGFFGFVTTIGGLYNFQIPLYASYHPKDNFDIYLSPRYIGQFGGIDEASGYLSYFGVNGGMLWGRNTKFGIDIGYYGLDGEGESSSLLQIGIGMKFVIGSSNK